MLVYGKSVSSGSNHHNPQNKNKKTYKNKRSSPSKYIRHSAVKRSTTKNESYLTDQNSTYLKSLGFKLKKKTSK